MCAVGNTQFSSILDKRKQSQVGMLRGQIQLTFVEA